MPDDFVVTSNVLELIGRFQSVRAGMEGVGLAMKNEFARRILITLPSNMHWKHPSGALAGSFFYDGSRISSSLPYARRREEGFSGKTDSRVRFYANDPGAFYMKTTLEQVMGDGSINAVFTSLMDALIGGA